MKTTQFVSYLIPLMLCASAPLAASVAINSVGQTYMQDFNSLPSAHTSDPAWSNNGTLPGWHLFAGPNYDANVTNLRVRLTSSSGSDRAHVSYGNTTENRALGMQAGSSHRYSPSSAASNEIFGAIAVAFSNDTGATIPGFQFSYAGEQWHITSNRTEFDLLFVEYAIGGLAEAPAALSWIALPDADFTAPRHSGLTGNVSNAGNLPENRVAGLGTSVTGISWDAGDVLWLRWSTLNYPSSDSGLAMNDFEFTAIPEPRVWGLVAGLAAIALILRRRRS